MTNLLDLSRLQAGVLSVAARPVGLDDVVSRALDYTARDHKLDVDIPATLPEVLADPGLLERVVANLVENALRYTPPDEQVRVAASAHADVVELRVIDRGPGIPPGRTRGGVRPLPAPRRPRRRAAQASASAWRSRAASSRRCTAPSPWTTPRAAA